MNCSDYQDWLQHRFDGEPLTDHAEMDRHLSECLTCREWQLAARRLEEGLRLLTPLAPPAGLSNRIATQVLAEQRRTRRFRQRVLTAVAVAAGLLMLAWFGYPWWTATNSPVIPDAANTVVEMRPPELPPPTPSLNDSIAEAGSAVVSLAKKTTDGTLEQTRLLWPDPIPAPTLLTTDTLQQTFDPSAQGLRELEQGVSSGVEPVTSSLRRWGGMVLRTLPTEAERKPGF